MTSTLTRDGTVALVLVSHSAAIADGLAELVAQVAGPDVPIVAAGGGPDGSFGTDGGRVLEALRTASAGAGGVVLRLVRTLRTHLEPQSPVLHNSLRLAVGLALSVLLARTLGLSHAFWVVLGTLQVLRTSALGTGRTTVQALAGGVLGFAVGGLFVVLAGNHPALMWAALPSPSS